MYLWESIHYRRHMDVPSPVNPPVPPTWADVQHIFAHSRGIDLSLSLDAVALDGEPTDDIPTDDNADEREYAESHRDEAREEIRRNGFEAIAFYAPIHFWGRDRWGIYVNERIFFGACADIAAALPFASWDKIVQEMLSSLDRHEAFHAAVELFGLVVEDFGFLRDLELKWWIGEKLENVAEDLTPPNLKCPYEVYARADYVPSLATSDCLEEALATAAQFQAPIRTKGFRRALGDMADSAPEPYRAWRKYRHRTEIQDGVQCLAERLLAHSFDDCLVVDGLVTLDTSQYRTRWFPDFRPSPLDAKGPIPRWVYRPDSIRPPRFARAILGNVRLQELLHGLERSYNARLVSGGKHPAILFPNGKKIPYPTQRTVPSYLINRIARALNVTRNEILANCLGVHV